MNANLLANMLNMNQQNREKLQSAWTAAQRLSGNVSNLSTAQQALQAVGMGQDAIQKAGNLLNSPIAALVAKACGADIDKAKNIINILLNGSNSNSNSSSNLNPHNTNNDLSRLRAGLKQLRS